MLANFFYPGISCMGILPFSVGRGLPMSFPRTSAFGFDFRVFQPLATALRALHRFAQQHISHVLQLTILGLAIIVSTISQWEVQTTTYLEPSLCFFCPFLLPMPLVHSHPSCPPCPSLLKPAKGSGEAPTKKK